VEGFEVAPLLRPLLLALLPLLRAPDPGLQLLALRALHATLIAVWPRVPSHAGKLVVGILWAAGAGATNDDGGGENGDGGSDGDTGSRMDGRRRDPRVEAVRRHGLRLLALVLVLGGDAAAAAAKEVAQNLSALAPACAAAQTMAAAATAAESLQAAAAEERRCGT
ncbi:unnamed protein product, partial [Phaeothamnion confervicola]